MAPKPNVFGPRPARPNALPCPKCGRPKAANSPYCTQCKKLYDAQNFQAHRSEKSASASRVKRDLLDWYKSLKHKKSCAVCGYVGDEAQMDYDHIPGRGRKVMEVSRMARLGYSKDKIMAEMAKCQLICANCHRLVTKERRKRI